MVDFALLKLSWKTKNLQQILWRIALTRVLIQKLVLVRSLFWFY